jgi:hypothetical protein
MRPLLTLSILIVAATSAPHSCLSQVYYSAMPYASSYTPVYPNYVQVIAQRPVYATTYYGAPQYLAVPQYVSVPQYVVAPQSSCACAPASVEYTTNRPVAPVAPAPRPVTNYSGRNYTVFANGGEIYAADSTGQVWRLDQGVWRPISGPVS